MSDNNLDVIIVDNHPEVCEILANLINRFYVWGDVYVFSDVDEATLYCLNKDTSIAIFVVDVFLGDKTGFIFLDDISEKFSTVYDDTIMITGRASNDVVNMCVASNIHHLLEKPVREYVLQLAIRAVVAKYTRFAGKLLGNKAFNQEYNRIFLP